MKALPDQKTVQAFREDGVTVLRGLFGDWIEVLRSGVAHNMREPGPTAKIYPDPGGGGRFLSDYCNWDRIPEYRAFIFESPAARVGARLMDSRTARLFHEHVLVKEAGADIATPWHHDQPYYCIDGYQTVSLWIPLDEIPRRRTLEFIAGSHRWGQLFRPQRFNGQALNENDGLEPVPDIDADRDKYTILGWALSPGDAVAFDFRTLHGAPGNPSAHAQRRAFSLRLVGDDARFARREGRVTSPPFPTVTLANGALLDAPEFPLLA